MQEQLRDRIDSLVTDITSKNNITKEEASKILWATIGHLTPRIMEITKSPNRHVASMTDRDNTQLT